MSVRLKLVVLVLIVGIVPLSVLALTTLRTHQQAIERRVADAQRAAAREGLTHVQASLAGQRRQLGLLAGDTIRWGALTAEERVGAAWLVFRQLEDAAAVAILDAQGQPVTPTAYVDDRATEQDKRGRVLVTPRLVEAFQGAAAKAVTKRGQVLVGAPFEAPGAALVPLVLVVDGAEKTPWTVAVALSLRGLCATLAGAETVQGLELVLVDGQRRQLCPPRDGALPAADSGLAGSGVGQQPVWQYQDAAGRELIASQSRLPSGWTVVAQQSTRVAFAARRTLEIQALIWLGVSIVIALAAGIYLGRDITEPIGKLVVGARQLAKGNFDHRLKLKERDEFGRLAEAFDQMGEQIQERDAEIHDWNQQLQRRVEDRTRELEQAHEQLGKSQRAAALGSFSAGVAHELTNPLTSVLGIAQLLQARLSRDPSRAKDAALLEQAAGEAQRMRKVLKRMQSMSQRVSDRHVGTVMVHDWVDATARLVEETATEVGVTIVTDHRDEPPLALRGSFTQLQQALLQLLDNAVAAVGEGGQVILCTSREADRARVAVVDDGAGIEADKLEHIFEPFFASDQGEGEDETGGGLGLAIAYRVIDEHRGTIEAESELGVGTTMTIYVPLAGASQRPEAPESAGDQSTERGAS